MTTKNKNTKSLDEIKELKKEIFENMQKVIKGELKDSSLIGKAKKKIARIYTQINSEKIVVNEGETENEK